MGDRLPAFILNQSLPQGMDAGYNWQRWSGTSTSVSKLIRKQNIKMAGVTIARRGRFSPRNGARRRDECQQLTPLVCRRTWSTIDSIAWKASFAVVPPELADCYRHRASFRSLSQTRRASSPSICIFCTREATIRAVNSASTGSFCGKPAIVSRKKLISSTSRFHSHHSPSKEPSLHAGARRKMKSPPPVSEWKSKKPRLMPGSSLTWACGHPHKVPSPKPLQSGGRIFSVGALVSTTFTRVVLT